MSSLPSESELLEMKQSIDAALQKDTEHLAFLVSNDDVTRCLTTANERVPAPPSDTLARSTTSWAFHLRVQTQVVDVTHSSHSAPGCGVNAACHPSIQRHSHRENYRHA